jgi:hypothetical protein
MRRPDEDAHLVLLRRTWLSPSAALSVVRSGAGRGLLSLPRTGVPERVQRVWLVVMWHHRLAWHMPAGRVLSAGRGVLVFRGRTASGIRAGLTAASSSVAVASLMVLYLAAAAAPGVVLSELLSMLGLAEAARDWRSVHGLVLLAGASAVAAFVMTRPRSPGLQREARLRGLTGDAGWLVPAVGADGPTRHLAERALLEDWVARAGRAHGIRRLVVDSSVLGDGTSVPDGFAGHPFEGGTVFVADLSGPLPAEPTDRGRSTIGLGLLTALVPTALVLGLLVMQVVLPAELRSRACVADVPVDRACMRDVWDALYWAVTTATTTGYGDLTPKSSTGRWAALALMLFGVTFWGALISVLVTALQQDAAERDASAHRLSARVRRPGSSSPRDDLLDLLRRVEELVERLPADTRPAANEPGGAGSDPPEDCPPAGTAPEPKGNGGTPSQAAAPAAPDPPDGSQLSTTLSSRAVAEPPGATDP